MEPLHRLEIAEASGCRCILSSRVGGWRYCRLTFPVARYNHLTGSEMMAEKDACYRVSYSCGGIWRRIWVNIRHVRNPVAAFAGNLWYRGNALRLYRGACEAFDTMPGNLTMQEAAKDSE